MQQKYCPLYCLDDENLNKILFDLRVNNPDQKLRPRTEVGFIGDGLAQTMSRNNRLKYIKEYSSLVEKK